jgi:hypothetical protein
MMRQHDILHQHEVSILTPKACRMAARFGPWVRSAILGCSANDRCSTYTATMFPKLSPFLPRDVP